MPTAAAISRSNELGAIASDVLRPPDPFTLRRLLTEVERLLAGPASGLERASLLNTKGLLFMHLGRFVEAQSAFRGAATLGARPVLALTNQAAAALARGAPAEALELLRPVIDDASDLDLRLNYAEALQRHSPGPAADEAMQAAEALVDWKNPENVARFGTTLLDAGLGSRALAPIARVAELHGATALGSDGDTVIGMPRELHARIPWLRTSIERVFAHDPVALSLALAPESDDPEDDFEVPPTDGTARYTTEAVVEDLDG